jgi:hypothetical protein
MKRSSDNGIGIARVPHYNTGGIVCILIVLSVLVASLATLSWLFWILANGLLGATGAALTVVVLVACAAEYLGVLVAVSQAR